ncbi:MAG: hypothetical protein RL885_25195, partial [Planctomycetota bacterium]
PVAGGGPLHLDGILMAHHRGVQGGTAPSRGEPTERAIRIGELAHPSRWIAVLERDGHQVPLCSAIQWAAKHVCMETMVSRRDAEDVELLGRPVNRAQGPDRDKMLPVPLIAAPHAFWYLVGHRREVKKLLRSVTHLGSHRRQGYGVVRSWDVEALEDPKGRWSWTLDGEAVRHLPSEWCETAERRDVGCVEPPYWLHSRHVDRVPAGTICTVDPEIERAAHSIAQTDV